MSARAGGGEPRDAIPGSLAVELINNWSFLLDDVMDGDQFRRQRETAYVEPWGRG
jgi:geranylgeranyl diphosphate synthase type I